MMLKPIVTEKAVMLLETTNTITFSTDKKATKETLKKEVEDVFDVKVQKIRTLLKSGKKYAYITLKKEFPAIDIATKLKLL